MRFLKIFVVPLVILGVVLLATLAFYSDLPNGARIMLAPLLAELSLVLYFWKYHLTKNTKAGLFFVYMTFLVLLVFTVKIIVTFLYANGTIPWSPYAYIYFGFVGIVFVAGFVLKFMYGGVNESIKMQYKGEGNLIAMRELCFETIHELEKNKQETIKVIRLLNQVLEAIEYSDPVTHKKVIPIEKSIISKLETVLKHAKHKHFNKIRELTRGSTGVLQLLDERNKLLRDKK